MSSSSVLLRNLLVETKDGEWGKGEPFDGSVEMAVIRGTDFDTAKQSQLSGVPVRHIPSKAAGRKTLKPFDILIETAGGSKGKPTGKTTFLRPALFERSDLPITCASFARFLRIDPALADPEFVYWYLQNLYFNGVIENYQVQHTGIARFQFTKFADSIEIELPPISDQKQIAAFFGSIDDRITLLRETNATLEAIAQALFKSWFVDFDPVRAKAEGRQPEGMDAATAALFPNCFEESELGLVPRGWKPAKLGDVCDYINRGISPKYVEDGGVLVINQKCIRDFSVDYTKARRHDHLQRKIDGRTLLVGDVLVNSTGVGTLGRVAQILELPEIAIVDSHVTVVRAGPELNWPFLGQWMVRKQPDIEAMGEGSTGQTELARSKLAELSLLVPSAHLLASFSDLVTPLKGRIALNEARIRTITQLRDTLLPRLISGQLRLPEAESVIKEVC